MSIQDVVVMDRQKTGKEEAGRLRRSGLTPCVIYGLKVAPSSVSVEPKLVNKILRSEKGLNTVLNLRLEGTDETRHVMIKQVDRHPVNNRLLHVDFLRVDMDKKVTTVIPIELVGATPLGVKLGGVLTHVLHEMEIECVPQHIPSALRLDASKVGMDEALRVKDLPVFEGVEYKLAPSRVVCVVHPPDKDPATEEEEAEA